MIHNIIWIKTKVGRRNEGLALLKEMATHISGEYGLLSRVGIPVTSGPLYLAGLVTAHKNMGSMQTENEKLGTSDFFADWFGRSEKLFSWKTAEWQTLRVVHSSGESGDSPPNFVHTISVHVTPGKLFPAREHLKKITDHMAAAYGRRARVLNPEGGEHYRHIFSTDYDTLDQYESVSSQLEQDETFAQWANEMPNLFDMKPTTKNIWAYI